MMTDSESRWRNFSSAVLAVLAGGALALPLLTVRAAAGELQPNFLDFGSVRVGATAEGSVRIFRDGEDSSGLAIKIAPPAFVRVEDIKIGSQNYGGNIKGYCDLWLSIDTKRAGDYSGALDVEIGRQRVAVPVSVTVRPQMPRLTRLLVVETPFSRFSTSDAAVFKPWLDLVSEAHFDVHYLDARRGSPVLERIDLDRFDVVLLGMDGLVGLLDSDVKLLRGFMERGGRTIVAANAFFRGTVGKANELLVPYGLRMRDTEPRDQHEFRLGAAEITRDPLTEGVKTLHFHRPSPIAVTDPRQGTVLAAVPGEPTEGFVAVARAGRGEVVALGESLWWNWLANDKASGSDNAVLLGDLLKKPGPRK